MRKGSIALAIVGTLSAAAIAMLYFTATPHSINLMLETNTDFVNWVALNGRQYATKEEYLFRKQQFEASKALIEEHNSRNESWKMALSNFADWTPEEFQKLNGLKNYVVRNISEEVDFKVLQQGGPIDWRGYMNPVRNQLDCLTCWAFSTIATLEGRYAIKYRSKVQLSEQQLVDCSGSNCLQGGNTAFGLEYIKKAGGSMLRSVYPYINGDTGYCAFDSSYVAAEVLSVNSGVLDYSVSIKNALMSGPVGIALQTVKGMQFYDGESIFDDVCAQPTHAVALVGWGYDGVTEFWIIRNSWGLWDRQRTGHIKIKINGKCKIYFDAFPVVA